MTSALQFMVDQSRFIDQKQAITPVHARIADSDPADSTIAQDRAIVPPPN
ncbi:hypothetical protein [Dactylosporangium siamense]